MPIVQEHPTYPAAHIYQQWKQNELPVTKAAHSLKACVHQQPKSALQQFELPHNFLNPKEYTYFHVITSTHSNQQSSETTLDSDEIYYDAFEYCSQQQTPQQTSHQTTRANSESNITTTPLKQSVPNTQEALEEAREEVFYDAQTDETESKVQEPLRETEEVFYDAQPFFSEAFSEAFATSNKGFSTTEAIQKKLEQHAQGVNWPKIQNHIKTILGDQLAALANPHTLLQLTIANTIGAAAASILGISVLPMLYMQAGSYTTSTILITLLNTLYKLDDISLNQYIKSLNVLSHTLGALPYALLLKTIAINLPYGGVASGIASGTAFLMSNITAYLVKPLAEGFASKCAKYTSQLLGYLQCNNPHKITSKLTYALSAGASSGIIQAASLLILFNQIATPAAAAPLNPSNMTASPAFPILANSTTIPTINSSEILATTTSHCVSSNLTSSGSSLTTAAFANFTSITNATAHTTNYAPQSTITNDLRNTTTLTPTRQKIETTSVLIQPTPPYNREPHYTFTD